MQKSSPSSMELHRLRATTAGRALSTVAKTSLRPSPGACFHCAAFLRTSAMQSATSVWTGMTNRAGTKWFPPASSPPPRTFTGMSARNPELVAPCCSW